MAHALTNWEIFKSLLCIYSCSETVPKICQKRLFLIVFKSGTHRVHIFLTLKSQDTRGWYCWTCYPSVLKAEVQWILASCSDSCTPACTVGKGFLWDQTSALRCTWEESWKMLQTAVLPSTHFPMLMVFTAVTFSLAVQNCRQSFWRRWWPCHNLEGRRASRSDTGCRSLVLTI